MTRTVARTALAALLLAACGASPLTSQGDVAGETAAELGARFGACEYDERLDAATPEAILSTVVQWYRIDELPAEVRTSDTMTSRKTVIVDLPVTAIGPGRTPQGESKRMPVRLHGTYLPGVAWAVDHQSEGAVAYVGKTIVDEENTPDLPGVVTLVAVLTAEGEYFFPGSCEDRILRQTLTERFGAAAPERISDLIGRTGSDLISRLHDEPSPADVTDGAATSTR
jgi:hypothetical protein